MKRLAWRSLELWRRRESNPPLLGLPPPKDRLVAREASLQQGELLAQKGIALLLIGAHEAA
jgi:hypothetical protein